MRYVEEKYKEHIYSKTYRFYVTDSLANIPQNKFITQRYADIIKPHKKDRRTGDEIAADVINTLGLKFED